MTSTSILSAIDRWSVNQLARREHLHVSTIWMWMLHGVFVAEIFSAVECSGEPMVAIAIQPTTFPRGGLSFQTPNKSSHPRSETHVRFTCKVYVTVKV